MKRTLALVFLCWLAAAAAAIAGESSRVTLNLNREWRFKLGDPKGAEASSFDDTSWTRTGLPHSFSIPYFEGTEFYTGYGWYRKALDVPETLRGRRLFLEFDGVFQVAEIFVNGRKVGEHRGGYTGFSVEITDAVRFGAANELTVRVNNLWDARLAPRAGEHVFSGGIYRDVRLVAENPLHITWYGTFVTTPQVSSEAATVNVKTEIVNQGDAPQVCTVLQTLLDPDGKIVQRWQGTESVGAGSTVTFDQTSQSVRDPKLWHPDHPFLYTVKTTVFSGGSAVDETSSRLGFRWFKWTADKGFFLNGEHYYLIGANVHQDHAGWGDAVTDAGFYRDVKLVKEAGFNFIRGSHYPHDPAFIAACDELGVLFWSENSFWGIGGFKPDGYWNSSCYPPAVADQPGFEASVKRELAEMIRVDRNHPSIIAWSMGNETFFTAKSTLSKVRALLAALVKETHELDPTRPAAIGGVQRPTGDDRIDKIGDVAGYNGDGATLPIFQNPGVPSLVSEYGSVTARRPGDYSPGWSSLARDKGQPVHDWRSGQAVWCMFDHGSIAGDNLGRMGIVDYFRIPKRAWYWYRNEYRNIPPPVWPASGTPAKLGLTADKTTLASVDGTDDSQLIVTVLDAAGRPLSNSVPVTFAIVSGPGEFPTGPSITFAPGSDIAILDGKAGIEFRSYYAGATVIRATSPGLAPAEITITSQGEPRWIEGVTPRVAPRPYHRFNRKESASSVAAGGLGLAADRPTLASSTAAGSSPANVNDGDTSTAWQAGAGDRSPWIRIDLENTYHIDHVRLTFPEAGAWRYTLSVSADGVAWRTVAGKAEGADSDRVRTVTGDFGVGMRFIRVSFLGWPSGRAAALSEIAVGGE